jgi:hypothetical protein
MFAIMPVATRSFRPLPTIYILVTTLAVEGSSPRVYRVVLWIKTYRFQVGRVVWSNFHDEDIFGS